MHIAATNTLFPILFLHSLSVASRGFGEAHRRAVGGVRARPQQHTRVRRVLGVARDGGEFVARRRQIPIEFRARR